MGDDIKTASNGAEKEQLRQLVAICHPQIQSVFRAYELRGTPTLVINGEEKYVDDDFKSADAFAAYLDTQLAALSDSTGSEAN